MSVKTDLSEINELSKISQRWKQQGPKDQPKKTEVLTKKEQNFDNKDMYVPTNDYLKQQIKNSASKSFTNESQADSIDSEPFSIKEISNPWGNINARASQNKENNISSANLSKNRIRTHAPQVIDEDTEQFKIRLEHLINIFKTEATSEFMQMKRSMLDEQNLTIQHSTEKYIHMFDQKVNELADCNNQLSEQKKKNSMLTNQCEKMANFIANLKTQLRDQKTQQLAFKALLVNRLRENQKNYKIKMAQKLRKRVLQQQLFNAWKVMYQAEMNDKRNLRILDQHRKDMDELVNKFKKETEILDSKLKEAQEGLDEANKMKLGMQDNLRRAFMRGVCALNFEAMSVIQGGTSQIPTMPNLQIPQNVQIPPEYELDQYSQQNSQIIETNEHKWKNAPIVGKPSLNEQNSIVYDQFSQNPNDRLNTLNFQASDRQTTLNLTSDRLNSLSQQQSNERQSSTGYKHQQMMVSNLVQQEEFSEKSFIQEDEGKVIKVNIHTQAQITSKGKTTIIDTNPKKQTQKPIQQQTKKNK